MLKRLNSRKKYMDQKLRAAASWNRMLLLNSCSMSLCSVQSSSSLMSPWPRQSSCFHVSFVIEQLERWRTGDFGGTET